VVAGVLGAPVAAAAAPAALAFDIPAQPLADALVAFGQQAGVSVGAHELALCAPRSRAVKGRYTPAAALARLIQGTRCGFETVDPRAFSVGPRRTPAPPRRAAPAAAAAPAPQAPAEMLLDLTVTTTRRPSLISRTPASVSIASGEDLVAGRVDSLQDLAPEFAGVTVTNLGPGRNKVFVRGLSDGAFTGRTQSTVGLYLDDVPITYNAPDPDLRLVDVQRVELMRGPQGSLYGEGSMGGIVRIVTNKPDLEASTAGAAAGGALTDGGSASYAVDGVVNAPLIPGRLGLRIVGYSEQIGGYVDDVLLNLPRANRTRRAGGRVAVTGVLSPEWRVTAGVTGQSLRSSDSQYAQGGLPPFQRANAVQEPHDNDFAQGYVTVDGEGGWGQFKLSSAYLSHAFDSRYDATPTLPIFGSAAGHGGYTERTRVDLAVTEATLASPAGGRFEWLLGAFGSVTRQDLRLDLSEFMPQGARPIYGEDRHDRLGEAAIYGEASYALTPSLTVTAGLRAFYAWLRTTSVRVQGPVHAGFQGQLDSSDLSPKLVLSWQASPRLLAYVQAAQGYRVGGFNTSGRLNQPFSASISGRQPDRQFRPDELWSFEVGAKASLAAERLQLRTALFYADWASIQSDQFLVSGLPYTANVGRGVNTGLELEAGYRATPALTLRLNFLANGPQLTRRDPTYPARRNASLPAVPGFSGAFTVDYRRPIGAGLTAILHGRVGYVGRSILTFQEQAASAMGSYFTGRLSGGIETRRWRLTAFVDNPANGEGDTFAFGDPFTQGRVRQFTPMRPRTVGVTLAIGM
jgi:outer membrane receptor protein involved in Fe transport